MIVVKGKKGASTAEAVIVIIVVAVVVAILISAYINYTGDAKVSDCAVQRATIERCFKALYIDDEKLRDCKTQDEILKVTGTDVVKYMTKQDAYTGGKKCLTTGIPYALRFKYEKAGKNGKSISYSIKFICPCSPGFDGMEAVQDYCRQHMNDDKKK